MPSMGYGHSECCESWGLGSAYMDNSMSSRLPHRPWPPFTATQPPLFTPWGKENVLYESAIPEAQHTATHKPLANHSTLQSALGCVSDRSPHPVMRELGYTNVSSLSQAQSGAWGHAVMSRLLPGAHYGFRRVVRHPLQGPEMTSWKARRHPCSEGWLTSIFYKKPKVLGLGTMTHVCNPSP